MVQSTEKDSSFVEEPRRDGDDVVDYEAQILEEHINPNKTRYLPSHTRRRLEYAARTAWATTACLILLQFVQWTPVASELSPVISIISATLFFGAWQQAAFKVFYSSVIGTFLGAFIVGPSFRIPGLQIVLLFVTASFLNSIKQWDRLPKVIGSLNLLLGSLFPNLSNGKLTLFLTFYASIALVMVPYALTGLSLLFPVPAFSLFNAKNLVLIICRKLTLMTRALIRAFPSGTYLDLYIAEYDELYAEVRSDLAELRQMLGLLTTERAVLGSVKNMVTALRQFLTTVDKILMELNGIRDCVGALIQSQMQNDFNELLLDTLVEIDEEVEIALCVVAEFFETFLPFYLDNFICRWCVRVSRDCLLLVRVVWNRMLTVFGAASCCKGSGGKWGAVPVTTSQAPIICEICDKHIAEERSGVSKRNILNHQQRSPFKRADSMTLRKRIAFQSGGSKDSEMRMHLRSSSLHALRHRSRVRKIYNIPFSCDLITEHEDRAGKFHAAHNEHSHRVSVEQQQLGSSVFNHYSLTLNNVSCELPNSDERKVNCATCSVAANDAFEGTEVPIVGKSVRDDKCTSSQARDILRARYVNCISNLYSAQTALLQKYQEGRERIIILPFSTNIDMSISIPKSCITDPDLVEKSDHDADAGVSITDHAEGCLADTAIKNNESHRRTRGRGFTVDSIDPTGPPLCGSFQPTRFQIGLQASANSRPTEEPTVAQSNQAQNSQSNAPHMQKIRLDLRNLGRRASYVHRLCVLLETLSSLKQIFDAHGSPWSCWNDGFLPNVHEILEFARSCINFWRELIQILCLLLSELLRNFFCFSGWKFFFAGIWYKLMQPFIFENMQALKIAAAMSIASSLLIFDLAPSLYKDGLWTAAVIPLIRQDEASASFLTSYQRLEGTVIGSIFAFFVFQVFGCGTLERQCSPSVLLPVIIAWVGLCALFREGPRHGYAATVAGFTPIILLLGLQTDLLGAWGRIEETFVGIAIYLLIDNLFFPRRTYTMLKSSVLQCIDETRWLFSDSIRAAQVLLSLTIDDANNKTMHTEGSNLGPDNCGSKHVDGGAIDQLSESSLAEGKEESARSSYVVSSTATSTAQHNIATPADMIPSDHERKTDTIDLVEPQSTDEPPLLRRQDNRTIRSQRFIISESSILIFRECLKHLDAADKRLAVLSGVLEKQYQMLKMVVHEPDLWYRAVPTTAYERLTRSFECVHRAGQTVCAGYRTFSSLLIQMIGRKEPLREQLNHYNFFIKHSFSISEEAEKALCLAHDAFRRLYENGEFHADLGNIVILRRSADSLLRLSHQHFLDVYMHRPPHELLAINPYLNVAWQNLFESVFTLAEEVSALGMTLHSIRNIEALVSI